MSKTTSYPKKKIDGKTLILCQNSSDESIYYNGKACDIWVPINPDSTAALCYKCVMQTQQCLN